MLIGAAPSLSDPQDDKIRSLTLRETCEKQVVRADRDLDLERIKLPKFSGHKTKFDNFGYLSEVSWVRRVNQQSIR